MGGGGARVLSHQCQAAPAPAPTNDRMRSKSPARAHRVLCHTTLPGHPHKHSIGRSPQVHLPRRLAQASGACSSSPSPAWRAPSILRRGYSNAPSSGSIPAHPSPPGTLPCSLPQAWSCGDAETARLGREGGRTGSPVPLARWPWERGKLLNLTKVSLQILRPPRDALLSSGQEP